MRERARVFGEVAGDYADVRAGYADELVTAVFDYLGRVPERVVEPGAGTGKATRLARDVRLLSTFSLHRLLAEDRRARLYAGIAEVVDARGGVVGVRLHTALGLGRRR